MRHHLRFNIIVETENKNVLSEGLELAVVSITKLTHIVTRRGRERVAVACVPIHGTSIIVHPNSSCLLCSHRACNTDYKSG